MGLLILLRGDLLVGGTQMGRLVIIAIAIILRKL